MGVFLTKQKIVEPMVGEGLECLGIFVRLTEEARKHRAVLIDLGDESARLKLRLGGGGNSNAQIAQAPNGKGSGHKTGNWNQQGKPSWGFGGGWGGNWKGGK